ncbi:hypothetical protein GmHk_02G003534 [Glycine max]|nr:hypothetical protein GmHk_02G003534 [Glycine max]
MLQNEQVNETMNDTVIDDVLIVEDDIVVNENDNVEVDEIFDQPKVLSEDCSSDSEYNPIGEDANLNNVNGISDFDEVVDVIEVLHSDLDMNEIYEKKELNGRKQFELDNDGKIYFENG